MEISGSNGDCAITTGCEFCSLEKAFVGEGGLSERMTRAGLNQRRKQKKAVKINTMA